MNSEEIASAFCLQMAVKSAQVHLDFSQVGITKYINKLEAR